MICYRDITFCKSDCVNDKCHRFLSDAVRQGARGWWSHDPDNAPIAMLNMSEGCGNYIAPEEKT